jgi:hypothetical protein
MAVGFPAKTTYANGDVFSASDINDTNGTLNLLGQSVTTSAGKNAVINGGMDIWQRGTSFTVASLTNTFAADRWCGRRGATGMTLSRQTTSDTTNLPFIQYSLRMQRDSGNTATNPLTVSQSLETVNSIPYAGRTITVSFYARRGANFSATSNVVNCDIYTGTGTDQNVQLGYTGSVQSGQVSATLTTTWQRFSGSVSIPATATEMAVYFNYTPTGTAGAADFVEFTGVQLEFGSTVTTFSRAGAGGIQGELDACQRYYWRTNATNTFSAHGQGGFVNSSQVNIYLVHPVPMRISPSSLDYSNVTIYTLTDTNFAVSAVTLLSAVSSGLISRVQAGVTGGTAGTGAVLTNNNTTAGYVGLSAEL